MMNYPKYKFHDVFIVKEEKGKRHEFVVLFDPKVLNDEYIYYGTVKVLDVDLNDYSDFYDDNFSESYLNSCKQINNAYK